MKKVVFVVLLATVTVVGCQAESTKPSAANDNGASQTMTSETHTTMKPAVPDADASSAEPATNHAAPSGSPESQGEQSAP